MRCNCKLPLSRRLTLSRKVQQPGARSWYSRTDLPNLTLTGFLDANRYPPPDQVRGHASLESAADHDPVATGLRPWS